VNGNFQHGEKIDFFFLLFLKKSEGKEAAVDKCPKLLLKKVFYETSVFDAKICQFWFLKRETLTFLVFTEGINNRVGFYNFPLTIYWPLRILRISFFLNSASTNFVPLVPRNNLWNCSKIQILDHPNIFFQDLSKYIFLVSNLNVKYCTYILLIKCAYICT